MTSSHDALLRLIDTMSTLRGPGGCPWDAEQTHESLVPYLLEEVAELVDAVESGDRDHVREELGDVLYQILFHADIARTHSSDPFDIDDVASGVDAKMRSRHPHVFADGDAKTVDEVVSRWEEIKAEEKKNRSSVTEGVPERLSALARASSLLKRGAAFVEEPLPHQPMTEEELGEELLRLVFAARSQGLDAERALRARVRKLEQDIKKAETASSEGARGEHPDG